LETKKVFPVSSIIKKNTPRKGFLEDFSANSLTGLKSGDAALCFLLFDRCGLRSCTQAGKGVGLPTQLASMSATRGRVVTGGALSGLAFYMGFQDKTLKAFWRD
jgi:hypothetical protein